MKAPSRIPSVLGYRIGLGLSSQSFQSLLQRRLDGLQFVPREAVKAVVAVGITGCFRASLRASQDAADAVVWMTRPVRQGVFSVQDHCTRGVANDHTVLLDSSSHHPGVRIHVDLIEIDILRDAKRRSLGYRIRIVLTTIGSLRRVRPYRLPRLRQSYVNRVIDRT